MWLLGKFFFISFISSIAAGNESCPQPQTSEHLAAIEIMKLKHIIILQNKIDLVRESQAKEQYQQIKKFVEGKKTLLTYIMSHSYPLLDFTDFKEYGVSWLPCWVTK